jgi:hypothetical protein
METSEKWERRRSGKEVGTEKYVYSPGQFCNGCSAEVFHLNRSPGATLTFLLA